MKKLILILSLVICIQGIEAKAQEWAPDGAEWYYDYENFWFTGYVHISVLGDTVIHDTTCRVLRREAVIHNLEFGTTSTYYYGRSYMFSDEDRVYLFENNKFYTLYDFSAIPGDTIIIPQNSTLPQVGCDPEGMIVVLDTATLQINGETLRQITVTWADDSHWAIWGNIIETVGAVGSYLLPEPNWCVVDLFEGGPLRCYSDPEFGLYNTGMAPECDYLVSVPELNKIEIEIYPNPASSILYVDILDKRISELRLYNSNGMEIMSRHLNQSHNSIDVSGLRPGLYFIRVESANEVINRLIVIH